MEKPIIYLLEHYPKSTMFVARILQIIAGVILVFFVLIVIQTFMSDLTKHSSGDEDYCSWQYDSDC